MESDLYWWVVMDTDAKMIFFPRNSHLALCSAVECKCGNFGTYSRNVLHNIR